MRLLDLNAQFIDSASSKGHRRRESRFLDGAQGLLFQCPKCAAGKEVIVEDDGRRFVAGVHYIRIYFANPRGTTVAPSDADPRGDGTPSPRWEVSGIGLDDLTLQPSVNLDYSDGDHTIRAGTIRIENGGCKWHGWVSGGDAS